MARMRYDKKNNRTRKDGTPYTSESEVVPESEVTSTVENSSEASSNTITKKDEEEFNILMDKARASGFDKHYDDKIAKVKALNQYGNINSSNASWDKVEKMGKELGMSESELSFVKNKYNADKDLVAAKSNFQEQNGILSKQQKEFDRINNLIDTNTTALENLTGKNAKKVMKSNKALDKQRSAIGDQIKALEADDGKYTASKANLIEKQRIATESKRNLNSFTENAGEEAASRMKSLNAKMGAREISKVGRLGRYAVGAMVGIGLINMLTSNKGQMDNGQLYNPGGPI